MRFPPYTSCLNTRVHTAGVEETTDFGFDGCGGTLKCIIERYYTTACVCRKFRSELVVHAAPSRESGPHNDFGIRTSATTTFRTSKSVRAFVITYAQSSYCSYLYRVYRMFSESVFYTEKTFV